VPIPKKRTGNVAHDKALQKFYRATYEAVLRHINFAQVGVHFQIIRRVNRLGSLMILIKSNDAGTTQVKAVLLASPGFVNSDFFVFLNNEVSRRTTHACHTIKPHHTTHLITLLHIRQAQLKDDRALLQNKAKFGQSLGGILLVRDSKPDRTALVSNTQT
jgi:hypothetical protein